MNPQQTRCIIAAAGCHVLLVVILFLGPMLFWHQPVQDSLPILKVVPLSAIESALTSGTATPTPTPPVQQPQQTTPTPPPPVPEPKPIVAPPQQPVVQHDEPKPDNTPDETPSDNPSPVPVPKPKPKPKHKPQEIDVDLTPVVQNSSPDDSKERAEKRAQARAAQRAAERAAEQHREAVNSLLRNLDKGFSSSTDVQMPGSGSQATANYGQIVKSIYYEAWNLPGGAAGSDANVTVHVVIGRDGHVISAHVTDPSGDSTVDQSVRRALDSVSFIQPFAEGAKEDERTYNIIFDAQAKRNL